RGLRRRSRHLALDSAGIEPVRQRAREPAHLLGHFEGLPPLDDELDGPVAVAGCEQEARAVGADLLVLSERRLHALDAARVVALADEVGRAAVEAPCVLGDALVHLAERGLRPGLSLF